VTVYVDNARIRYRRMLMCHMVADTREELVAMADRIGVARRWIQCAGTYREHFDVCSRMRIKSLDAGAQPISQRDLARFLADRKRR
jgi:hypothetical protein